MLSISSHTNAANLIVFEATCYELHHILSLRAPPPAPFSSSRLSFGRDHFGTSGAPWGTIGAAGWTQGGPESEFQWFSDFGTILKLIGYWGLKFRFEHFCYRVLNRNLSFWGFKNKVLARETMQKIVVHRTRCYRFGTRFMMFFSGRESSFYEFCGLGDRSDNWQIAIWTTRSKIDGRWGGAAGVQAL